MAQVQPGAQTAPRPAAEPEGAVGLPGEAREETLSPSEAVATASRPSVPQTPPSPPSFASEVLVPPGLEDALLQFAAGLEGRTVTPTSILVAEPSLTLNPPRPLHRVEIESLAPGFTRESDF